MWINSTCMFLILKISHVSSFLNISELISDFLSSSMHQLCENSQELSTCKMIMF